MKPTLRILRGGSLTGERWVTVSQKESKSRYRDLGRFDPQDMVLEATGRWVDRDYCIVSFACGLVDAGYEVRILDHRNGRNGIVTRFVPVRAVTLYYAVGLFWATGSWNAAIHQMRNFIVPQRRLEVLRSTGDHFWQMPKYQIPDFPRLRLPG